MVAGSHPAAVQPQECQRFQPEFVELVLRYHDRDEAEAASSLMAQLPAVTVPPLRIGDN